MFIQPQELKTHLYDYQVDQITDADNSIVVSAISTAEAEVKSYLANRFDTDRIFSQSGNNRHPLIIEHVKVCACHHLLHLANVDAIFDRYERAYEQSIAFLQKVADGALTPDLPYRESTTGNPPGTLQISSNPKFNHNF